MANTLITPSVIAREAAIALSYNLVAAGAVHRDFATDFTAAKVGDAITIAKPASFTANDFTTSISEQNITEGSATLTLEKFKDVSFAVTSKELTLSLDKFNELVLNPAVIALAESINAYVLGKHIEIPYWYNAGSASSPALADSIAEVALAKSVLNRNRCPMTPRVGILSDTAEATFLGIDNFIRNDARGNGDTIRTGELGYAMGIDWKMDQQVVTHTAGTFSTTGTPLVNGAVSAGALTMAVDGGSASETLKKGDLFTVANVTGQFVVTADVTASSGAMAAVAFYPAAPTGGFANDAALTIVRSHKSNLILHPNCMSLAVVPLEIPDPGTGVTGAYINFKGIGVRVLMGYSISAKKKIISIDCLFGAKVWQPELGMRLLEATG